MKKILSRFIISFSITSLLWLSFALDIPVNDGYVLDQANILTQQQEQILENTILNARKTTDIEIWMLIINSLQWEDIFDYSFLVADERWVGDKNKDNGLFMLFAMQDRERRIQVWYGLEWVITDSITKRLWEKNIPDNFRQWLYFDWINNTVQDIINYINKDPETLEYINANTNNINDDTSSDDNDNGYFMWFIALIFLIKSLVLKYDKKKKKSKMRKWWRIALIIIGIVLWVIGYLFVFPWAIIESWIFWFVVPIIWLIVWLLIGDWSWLLWIMLLSWWWRWGFGSGSSGWSSFWWFWWGWFWGGGAGWRR